MATKVPISVENIAFERLNLSRHYLTIDCDFTCFLVLNPSGQIPSEGTDIAAFHVGAWQVNAWTLLTKKDFPNQAGFSACLVWDKTLVTDTARAPSAVESDIDLSNSVSNLKGQPVNIVGFSMPSGDSLPVSLVSSSLDGAISVDNPLFVRDVRRRYYLFSVGSACPLSVLSEVGAVFDRADGEYDIYKCFPNAFFAKYADGGVLGVYWGVVTHLNSSLANAARYTLIYGVFEIYRERETGNINSIRIGCWLFGYGGSSDVRNSDGDITELDISCP